MGRDMLNIAGVLVYLLVAGLAMRAASRSHKAQRPRAAAVHWRTVSLVFAALALWRLAGAEAQVQDFVRDLAHHTGSYAARRELQTPLVGLALIAGAVFALWTFFSSRGDPAVRWSRFATMSLLAYSAVRMVSLHAVDAILYASVGPFHINHFIDLGLAAIAGYYANAAAKRIKA